MSGSPTAAIVTAIHGSAMLLLWHASATDAGQPLITQTHVFIECGLRFFPPLGFSLQLYALRLPTLATFLLCLMMRPDALSLGFHLLLCAEFDSVDGAVLRAAPTDIGVSGYEPFIAYLALAAMWFSHPSSPPCT